MQDVAAPDPIASETAAVSVISDLEDPALNRFGVFSKEAFYIVAIDRRTAIVAEEAADGLHASQTAPINYGHSSLR